MAGLLSSIQKRPTLGTSSIIEVCQFRHCLLSLCAQSNKSEHRLPSTNISRDVVDFNEVLLLGQANKSKFQFRIFFLK